MKKLFKIILLLIVFLPSISFGAGMFIDAGDKIFSLNEDFLVEVYVDTDDKKVNALEGTIIFPLNLLELKEIRDGNSSINFWIEKPHSKNEGEVSFSGITAGGISGDKKFLFGLVFHPKKTGASSILFKNVQVLENDGLGTKVLTKEIPFAFSITKESSDSAPANFKIEDQNPPEDFNPFIGNDPDMFEGHHFLVFSTVDKGTGIDHYEVRESYWGLGGEYAVIESPYLLKDQTLKSKIYIKAVDKAGNQRVVKLNPQNDLVWLEQAIIIAIILGICFFLLRKTLRKSNR